MLVKMAEAIGRIVLAGREMTRLAGYALAYFIISVIRLLLAYGSTISYRKVLKWSLLSMHSMSKKCWAIQHINTFLSKHINTPK